MLFKPLMNRMTENDSMETIPKIYCKQALAFVEESSVRDASAKP